MARCDDCKANKVCDHNRFGFENCRNFIPADVVPRAEVAREILSDLKKKIHDRAVYTGSRDIPNYIDLKTLDAIIDKIAKEAG